MRLLTRLSPLLLALAFAPAPLFGQPTSGGVALPVTAPVASESTTPATQVPPARARAPRVLGEGMEWLARATEADDFIESPANPASTLPYARSAEGLSTLTATARTFQPAGALSGRIVYLMAGHGWTYKDETQTWYTQRPPTHGMIEDFGNIDQMHIFAHLVWNAGGTVVPLRPVDHQPEERIVDNSMPQATFYGPWFPSNSKLYYGTARDKVPYLYARAATEETAVARFRPYIPVTGDYPVYVWGRDGADRVQQIYRVAHTGGVHEVRVNHRLVGKGWIWLGTYRFAQGDMGYVEVSNKVSDPYLSDGRHVVVADAVRFGNGRGDVPRDAGISSYLREDEGDCYWIERSLGPTAPRRLYTSGRADGSATISAPPKTVAYMNRETEGRYTDRVLISFHSNASNGKQRGAVSLFNKSPEQRPPYQELLAELTGRQINEDMSRAPSIAGLPWANRTRHTYSGINFGELRKDYLQGEVCATIVEVAFHDEPNDAFYLLNPTARLDLARSTMRGLIKWFDALELPRHATAMPPAVPRDPVAFAGTDPGTVRIEWRLGPADRIVGNPAVDYRVFSSYDGRAFDGGTLSDGQTSLALGVRSPASPVYACVAGVNASGESLATRVVAVRLKAEDQPSTAPAAKAPHVLIVDGMSSLDNRLNTQYRQRMVDPDAGPGWTIGRVRPLPLMGAEGVVRAAEALTSAGATFDTVPASAFAVGEFPLAPYQAVVWLSGRQDPREGVLSAGAQRQLANYVRRGGKLFLSGSHVAESLLAPVRREEGDDPAGFARKVLGITEFTTNSTVRTLEPTAQGAGFPDFFLEPPASPAHLPDPLPAEAVASARGDAVEKLFAYDWPQSGTAAVATQNVVYFSFPFESIYGATTRSEVMHAVLDRLGVSARGSSEF